MTVKRLFVMQINLDDWNAATGHLDDGAFRACFKVAELAWRSEVNQWPPGHVPDDDEILTRVIGGKRPKAQLAAVRVLFQASETQRGYLEWVPLRESLERAKKAHAASVKRGQRTQNIINEKSRKYKENAADHRSRLRELSSRETLAAIDSRSDQQLDSQSNSQLDSTTDGELVGQSKVSSDSDSQGNPSRALTSSREGFPLEQSARDAPFPTSDQRRPFYQLQAPSRVLATSLDAESDELRDSHTDRSDRPLSDADVAIMRKLEQTRERVRIVT